MTLPEGIGGDHMRFLFELKRNDKNGTHITPTECLYEEFFTLTKREAKKIVKFWDENFDKLRPIYDMKERRYFFKF